jgi:Uma2 family endonuclease
MVRRAYVADVGAPQILTAEQLLKLNIPDKRTELVQGRLVVREPAGFRHGAVAVRFGRYLDEFVSEHDLGIVVGAETGFKLSANPDTVRAPDCAFVAKARLPHPLPRGYFPVAPDLAVEVLSPDDRPGEVSAKVVNWLSTGCQLVWVFDPERRVGRVYRADGTESQVTAGDAFDGEQLLPGFTLRLQSLT